MVDSGTVAYLEVSDSDLFPAPLPAGAIASAFINRDFYLALANYGTREAIIETTDTWRSCTDESLPPGKRWQLAPRSLTVVKRV